MNEITLQAVQIAPRLISVIILLSITWLVAKFTQSMILRTVCQCKDGKNAEGLSKTVSKLSFWAIILLIAPFILKAVGLEAAWLWKVQIVEGQFFSNWPILMLVSVLAVAASPMLRRVPKFYVQMKGSSETSPKELQS